MTETLKLTPDIASKMWRGKRYRKPLTKEEIEHQSELINALRGCGNANSIFRFNHLDPLQLQANGQFPITL